MNKKVLVLAAHPDDETLGLGGTISKLSDEGCYIKLMTFTDGLSARGPTTKNRNDKLDAVCGILGIDDYCFANYPDNRMDIISLLDKCKFIEKNIDFDPDIIFTHHPGCLNIDHELVYRATITVFRPQTFKKMDIMSYYVPSSTDYNPMNNFRSDVYHCLEKQHVEKKMEALKIYHNEMREYPHSRSYENALNRMKVDGSTIGCEHAEAFQLIRRVL